MIRPFVLSHLVDVFHISKFSVFSIFSMFSQLPPCSPIRDGRMEQFVEHCCDHCHCCKCKTIISLEMRNEFRKRFKLSVDPSARFKSRYNCTQGCIICSILPSGMGARGVNSEHVEKMEMFSCSPNTHQ